MTDSAERSSCIEHVVFDLDGTLADTAGDIANAANHARGLRGLPPLPVAAVRDQVGGGARKLIAELVPCNGDQDLDEALSEFLHHYNLHLLDETKLYPGIAALLRKLNEAGVSCSVLSNKPAALCRDLADGLGIARHFTHVLGGDSFPAKKPDPVGIRHLQSELSLPASALLLVGDSAVDRDTADAAGIAFCGVTWGFAPASFRTGQPVRLVSTPHEIFTLTQPL